MHGYYRLNILRVFTIASLFLVAATSFIVVFLNFKDQAAATFFSSMNHLVLIGGTVLLVASELRLLENFLLKYFPLISTNSSLITLGLTQMFFASFLLSDRHCVLTTQSPPYLDKLLLTAPIISAISGSFNAMASLCFGGPRLRVIRRYGTPSPDIEKGSTAGSYMEYNEPSPPARALFKNLFSGGSQAPPARPVEISRPYPAA